MKVVKLSPKGQITIPKEYRNRINVDQYMFEIKGNTITLRPVKIEIFKDETDNFGQLSNKSFEFWESKDDDIYEEFYK